MKRNIHLITFLFIVFVAPFISSYSDQQADPDFKPAIQQPSYSNEHPKVLFDQAHNNVHKAGGTYKPFVDLIKADGYSIDVNTGNFSPKALNGYDIVVISNAKGGDRKYDPAFSEEECRAVEDWVRDGGSLLLIADHYPFGSAAEILSKHFGVGMSRGFTNDSLHCDSASIGSSPIDGFSQLVFSRENVLLMDHPITNGRDSNERVNRIITFTGQSLSGPEGSDFFLPLAESAYDVIPDSVWEVKEWIVFTNTMTRFSDPVSVAGRSQGLALAFGKGRVVVFGEAAMLTAQVSGAERFGMQLPGIDNRQLALNIMHWLSRLL